MVELEEKCKRIRLARQFLFSIILLMVGGMMLSYIMREQSFYASGCDIWGHLLKSDMMYENIKEGNWYPLYTKYWYNGMQPYRYWAPLPYYTLASLQFLANGDVMEAYYLFAFIAFFFGGLGWVLFGYSTKRIPFCTAIGCLWFFLPENFRVYYCEGNLPRMMTAILIPYLVWFVWRYVCLKKNRAMVGITLFMALISLCHVMISAMMGITTFVFLFIYAIYSQKIKRCVQVIVGMLLGYLLIAIWLIPALSGGLVGMNAESTRTVMEALTYKLSISLNPFNRLYGVIDTFYYGISVTLISIFGCFLAKKREKAGFITAILILLFTTPESVFFLSKLPLSQLFWMMRFSTIAYAYFAWSLIELRNTRRFVRILILLLLFVDCIPSFSIARYYTQTEGRTNDEVDIAKRITNQRVILLDFSTYGSYPSYELCKGEDAVPYSYGWAWQGAATSSNIVLLNTAFEKEKYEYLFDRCLELGNDTVLLKKEEIGKHGGSFDMVLDAAEKVGYQLYTETNDMLIFHMDTPKNFGIKTEYTGLAIGTYASHISLVYPEFQLGTKRYLDEYTLEELANYKVIYLSGFEYRNKFDAETLVALLSEQGVRVIIDMSHIPLDQRTRRKSFLSIMAQDIFFESYFPTLFYKNQEWNTDYFPEDYRIWNTCYVEGAPIKLGSVHYNNHDLVFAGMSENENVIYLGFNLLFYATESEDEVAYQILDDLFLMQRGVLPKRTLVPMNIMYSNRNIIIDSVEENVNTTIAFQDNFESVDGIINENNLLGVTRKHTVISLVYPHKKIALFVNILGVIAFLWYLSYLAKSSREDKMRRKICKMSV